jgi:peptidyl-prolyl cis-trans isomerase C
MNSLRILGSAALSLGLAAGFANGQGTAPPRPPAPATPVSPPAPAAPAAAPAPAPKAPTAPAGTTPAAPSALIAAPPAPNTVAVTVNAQPIMEFAIQRALKSFKPDQREQVRPDIITFLVDKALIDQHVAQFKVQVEAKEVDAKLKQVREEIEKRGSTFDKVMRETLLTEAELRSEIEGQLRWEAFVQAQATDKALRELFDKNHEIFDGTMVRARHILLTADDPKAVEQGKAKLLAIKKQIEDTAVQGLTKLPATADALAREKERAKLTEDAFSAAAGKESACPSKSEGGDLGFFPRSGRMVEPFAQAAFALKLHQVSDVVATEFGLHLILVTDRKPGKQIKYEEVQEEVRMVFGDRLRDSLLPQLRAKAKVVITPPKP